MGQLTALSIALAISGSFDNAMDIGAAKYPISFTPNYSLADGAGANQANKFFTDTRTLAASANEDLDLNGAGLVDAFGTAIAITKLRGLVITADAANVNDVVVGAAASNAISTIFGATTHNLKVKPGGLFVLMAPDVNGYAVTAATADLLRIANGGAGSAVNYSIVIFGS